MLGNLQDRSGTSEPLLSIEAAQQLLGISKPTIYRLISRGEIPIVGIGRRRLIEPEALRAFIASKRIERKAASVS